MAWKLDENLPLYLQVMNKMKMRIANGTYPLAEKLPSVRDLANEAGVNPNTVQKAYAKLEEEGLIVTMRTNGKFVSDDEEVIKQLRKDLSDTVMEEFYQQLLSLGLDESEILETLSSWMKKRGEKDGKDSNL